MWGSAATLFGGWMVVAIGLAIIVGIQAGPGPGFVAFSAGAVLAWVLANKRRTRAISMCGHSCCSAAASVEHLGWNGSISSFSFSSHHYAVAFANENGRNLINVSMQLRELLAVQDAAMIIRSPSPHAAPPPAVPQSSGSIALERIARIESFKGPEARRNALRRALAEVADSSARRDIIVAASRIEAAAVLDKVDSLSTTAAKRRHLERALFEFRQDEIPDDLQADGIRQLEARLAQLR